MRSLVQSSSLVGFAPETVFPARAVRPSTSRTIASARARPPRSRRETTDSGAPYRRRCQSSPFARVGLVAFDVRKGTAILPAHAGRPLAGTEVFGLGWCPGRPVVSPCHRAGCEGPYGSLFPWPPCGGSGHRTEDFSVVVLSTPTCSPPSSLCSRPAVLSSCSTPRPSGPCAGHAGRSAALWRHIPRPPCPRRASPGPGRGCSSPR